MSGFFGVRHGFLQPAPLTASARDPRRCPRRERAHRSRRTRPHRFRIDLRGEANGWQSVACDKHDTLTSDISLRSFRRCISNVAEFPAPEIIALVRGAQIATASPRAGHPKLDWSRVDLHFVVLRRRHGKEILTCPICGRPRQPHSREASATKPEESDTTIWSQYGRTSSEAPQRRHR